MLGRLEHVDLGALIAPRPLLIETGTEDLLFPVAAAQESVARLRRVYEPPGAGDRLVHDVFDGDHQWHGVLAYPFLDRWLGHRPAAELSGQSSGEEPGRAGVEVEGGVRRGRSADAGHAVDTGRAGRRAPARPCAPRARRRARAAPAAGPGRSR